MKIKLRKNKIIVILLFVFIIFTTNVYAINDSFSITINANKQEIKREQNVIITIGLSNIAVESGEQGIGAYTGSIKFDTSVFEYVSTSGTSKWDKPFYQNGLITATTTDGEVVKTAQNIGTIIFKVKKDAKLGDTIITLKDFSGSSVEKDIYTSNKSITIKIVDSKSENTNSGNVIEENENNSSKNEIVNEKNENTSSKNEIVSEKNENTSSKNEIVNEKNENTNNKNESNNNENTSKKDENNIGEKQDKEENNKDEKYNIINEEQIESNDKKLPETGTKNKIIFILIGICIIFVICVKINYKK